jgi:cation:H+ antiporter
MNLVRRFAALAGVAVLMSQWPLLQMMEPASPVVVALSTGVAIFAAAFALSWGAEVSQLEIPASLAVVFVALLAVLPEYAVDMYFAWQAGQDPQYTQYATANMTGANRLLIGLGWPLVVLTHRWRTGQRRLVIATGESLELYFLLLATLYSFVIPAKGTLGPADMLVLVVMFLAYVREAARETVVEPELEGTAASLALLPRSRRRAVTGVLFVAAGATIFCAAEPFAESLLAIGERFSVEKFLLVQWLAPLASETPEFVVALVFAWRANATLGFSALLSSKVNQWTLLVGMLPLAFAASSGAWEPMLLDARQRHEILLTSAQSLFAIVLVADLGFSAREGAALLVLFGLQLLWSDDAVRAAFVWVYFGGAGMIVLLSPGARRGLVRLVAGRWRPR